MRQLAVPCRAYFSEQDELVSVRSAQEFADVPQAVVTMLCIPGTPITRHREDLPLLQHDFRAMLQQCEKNDNKWPVRGFAPAIVISGLFLVCLLGVLDDLRLIDLRDLLVADELEAVEPRPCDMERRSMA